MIGQYTEQEIKTKIQKGVMLNSVDDFINGYIQIKIGYTINYYKKEQDGSWTNYNCRTVY
ncbi:unnamed protein product [marine sediment metagenome]|uniref:Uncharacterized protein n=1 Tax=marine sediment metagenome TaxID=412755 RepID=X0VNT2_9ZZZZ